MYVYMYTYEPGVCACIHMSQVYVRVYTCKDVYVRVYTCKDVGARVNTQKSPFVRCLRTQDVSWNHLYENMQNHVKML